MVRGSPAAATVSAVIPVHNGSAFVADAIESVYAQTVVPDELIVVDDGSTDETPAVLSEFEGHPGFILIRISNGGEANARNVGVEHANGTYVAFLDHDDVWRPQKLEHQLAQFDDTWGMSFTAYELMTATGSELRVLDTWDPDPEVVVSALERGPAIKTSSTVLVRRDALRAAGPFEEVPPFGTDWLMWLRLAAAGNAVGYLAEPLTEYRWHGANMSDDRAGSHDSACAIFDLYGDRRLRAWRRLLAAIYAHEQGDRRRARHRIIEAARIHPLSVRPGWVRLLF